MKMKIFPALAFMAAAAISAAGQTITCTLDVFTTEQLAAELQRRQQRPTQPPVVQQPVIQPRFSTRYHVPGKNYISVQVGPGLLNGRFDVENGLGVEMWIFDDREFAKFQQGREARSVYYSGYNMNWSVFNVALTSNRNYVVFRNDNYGGRNLTYTLY